MEYTNNVILYGTVTRDIEYSHEYNSVPFYSVDLECIRLHSSKKISASVRCYFSGEQLAQVNIKEGAILRIEGKLINSKTKGLIDISVLVREYSELEELSPDSESEVEISGEVTKIFTDENNYKGFINFVVAHLDEDGKRLFSTRVVIWNRLSEYVFNNLNIGDHVVIKGYINNSKTKSREITDNTEPEMVLVSEVLGCYFSKIDD